MNGKKDNNSHNNIFIKKQSNPDINNKLSYTNLIESIPSPKTRVPIENWQHVGNYLAEWRWRILFYNNTTKAEIRLLFFSLFYQMNTVCCFLF